MVEINLVGLSLGVTLTLLAVGLHYARGTGWTPTADISQEVLEQRASAVPETDFPEPMNRSIGGGAAPAAVPAGDAEESATYDVSVSGALSLDEGRTVVVPKGEAERVREDEERVVSESRAVAGDDGHVGRELV